VAEIACTTRPVTAPPKPAHELAVASAGVPRTAEPAGYAAVTAIVVDQLAAWVLRERISDLPADGGFARLRREGTYVVDLRFDHAITETAPGHAALYTGASPRESGIIGNEVLDADGKSRAIVRDERTSLVGATGLLGKSGMSLAELRVETLADVLRQKSPGARIVSVSTKDRGAVFGGGRKPTASVWYDSDSKGFVTSTAFGTELPRFANQPAANLPDVWAPLEPTWLSGHAKTPDTQDGEADVEGLGTAFPHPISTPEARRLTPFSDQDVLALALGAISDSRGQEGPLFLALSLSGNDFIGHAYGPDSWEAWDELRRLDALLARLLSALDQTFGSNRHAVLLSGDHGVAPLPEVAFGKRVRADCAGRVDRWERPCADGGRVFFDRLAARLEAEAARALGPGGPWLAGYVDPYVHFSAAGRALPAARRAVLVAALTKAMLVEAGVARVFDVSLLPATCPSTEDIDALVCRSVSPGKGGDLYLVSKPGHFIVSKPRPRGTTHGSPYLYDRSVPLLVRAPGRVPANRTIDEPVDFRAFPKTAAALLDIDAPPAAQPGRSLLGSSAP
jgi:hypothetical protein